MTDLPIGKTILRLRKEQCLTQEQLAGKIGISAGAVSKWESGRSFPDISLLAPLARALNTTLDILLSFQQELSDSDISDIKRALTDTFLYAGFDAGKRKTEKYLQQYPNSIGLKMAAAVCLQMYAGLSENPTDEGVREILEQALDLYKQASESKLPKYESTALMATASMYMALGNYEESEQILKKLSNNNLADPMAIYPALLRKQEKLPEAESLCQQMLLHYTMQMFSMLSHLSSIYKDSDDIERAKLHLDTIIQIENLLAFRPLHGTEQYYRLYLHIGDYEAAAKWFYTYTNRLLEDQYDYDNHPYFNTITLQVDSGGQKVLRKRLIEILLADPELDKMKGFTDYDTGIHNLNTLLETL